MLGHHLLCLPHLNPLCFALSLPLNSELRELQPFPLCNHPKTLTAFGFKIQSLQPPYAHVNLFNIYIFFGSLMANRITKLSPLLKILQRFCPRFPVVSVIFALVFPPPCPAPLSHSRTCPHVDPGLARGLQGSTFLGWLPASPLHSWSPLFLCLACYPPPMVPVQPHHLP